MAPFVSTAAQCSKLAPRPPSVGQVNAFRASGHLPPKGQVVPMAEELKTLRKQMAQLRLENEILKKAAAYFAKESL
jgi:transposase-like protein